MFMFALRFLRSGRKLKKNWVVAVWIIPVTTVILAFTNEWHHLIWTGSRRTGRRYQRPLALILFDIDHFKAAGRNTVRG